MIISEFYRWRWLKRFFALTAVVGIYNLQFIPFLLNDHPFLFEIQILFLNTRSNLRLLYISYRLIVLLSDIDLILPY